METLSFKAQMRAHEVNVILAALRATGGNQVRAAERLEMPLRTLVYKISNLGLREAARRLRESRPAPSEVASKDALRH